MFSYCILLTGVVFFFNQVLFHGLFDFCFDLGEKCFSYIVSKVLASKAYSQLLKDLSVSQWTC